MRVDISLVIRDNGAHSPIRQMRRVEECARQMRPTSASENDPQHYNPSALLVGRLNEQKQSCGLQRRMFAEHRRPALVTAVQ